MKVKQTVKSRATLFGVILEMSNVMLLHIAGLSPAYLVEWSKRVLGVLRVPYYSKIDYMYNIIR
jgi:hypothetical protein